MTDEQFNKKQEELISLLNYWNTKEGADELYLLLQSIVHGAPNGINSKEDYFRYGEVFKLFTEAQIEAWNLYKASKEADEYGERIVTFRRECYEQALAQGKTEEEAHKFAEDMVKENF